MTGPAGGNIRLLTTLFARFFRVGLFTIGGGYAMVPVIEHEVVRKAGWLSATEFEHILFLAQSCPGPIAVNSSVLIGRKLAGRPGAFIGALGTTLPSFLVMLVFAAFVGTIATHPRIIATFAAVRGAIVALIVTAAWRLVRRNHDLATLVLTAAFLSLMIWVEVNPFLIVVAGIAVGVLRHAADRLRGRVG